MTTIDEVVGLERALLDRIKQARSVADTLVDLVSVVANYADEYKRLATTKTNALMHPLLVLYSQIKQQCVDDLQTSVLQPFDAFLTHQATETKHCLSELSDALTRSDKRSVTYDRLQLLQTMEEQRTVFLKSMRLRVLDAFRRMALQLHDEVTRHQLAVTELKAATEASIHQSLDDADRVMESTALMTDCFVRMEAMEQQMIRKLAAFTSGKSAKAMSWMEENECVLVPFHRLWMTHLLDPICRTLKFSKQKQERIRKESLQTLEGTRCRLATERAQLVKQKAKLQQPTPPDDALRMRMNGFLLRTAGIRPVQAEIDALVNKIQQLERQEAIEVEEMTQTLQKTALTARQTMALMLNDHLKHVHQACQTLASAMDKHMKECMDQAAVVEPLPVLDKCLTEWQPRKEEPTASEAETESEEDDFQAHQTQSAVDVAPRNHTVEKMDARPQPNHDGGAVIYAVMIILASFAMVLLCMRMHRLENTFGEIQTHGQQNLSLMRLIRETLETNRA